MDLLRTPRAPNGCQLKTLGTEVTLLPWSHVVTLCCLQAWLDRLFLETLYRLPAFSSLELSSLLYSLAM